MPFQPINFASIPAQGNPFLRNFMQTLMQGYQAGQMPFQMQRQQEQEELANSLHKLRLENEPERFKTSQEGEKLQQALQEADLSQREKEANSPFGGKFAPGAIGQSMYLEAIGKQYGTESPEYKSAKRYSEADLSNMQNRGSKPPTQNHSLLFRSLPVDERRRVISTAVAMGYDPIEAVQRLSKGETLNDLAEGKQTNLKDVDAKYPLSAPAITALNNRQAFQKEIENLEKNISEPMSLVSKKYWGYSPEQMWGVISGKHSPDQQGKILAARALQPELAALRLRAAGGQVGIEAIREMQHAALGKLNILEPLVSSEAYEAMNKYIGKYLEEAVSTYNKQIKEGSRLGNSNEEQRSSPKRLKFNPVTGGFE